MPQPPVGLHMSSGWQALYTVGVLLPLTALAAYALRIWLRERDVIPLLCLVGGAVCTLFEPIVDVLGLCWYPRAGQVRVVETLGRPIPLFVVFGYMWFMGGLTIVAYRRVQRRGTSDLWRLYPILMVVEAPFEWLAVHTRVYVYYGHQPLNLFSWPVWWAFVNTAVPLVAAVAITRLRPWLHGWRVLAVVALIPMADGLGNGATAWPVWSALNSNPPAPVVQLAGLATCGLAVFLVWIATYGTTLARTTSRRSAAPNASLMSSSGKVVDATRSSGS